MGSLLAAIPAPLGLGQIELADGRWVTGTFVKPGAGRTYRDHRLGRLASVAGG